jgi:hypothetical protein
MNKSKADSTKDDKKPAAFVPRTVFELVMAWPQIYPGMEFKFSMRIQLVEDAQKVQTEFLMLPDAEQTPDRRHQMDARLIGLLSTKAPEGFPDLEVNGDRPLEEQLGAYLYPDDVERREGMRFICRNVMSKYWAAVTPRDYL